jgi:hypothetical protein
MIKTDQFLENIHTLLFQERYTEDLVHNQVARGHNVYPIRKAKSKMGLGMGPPLIASDASGIRHHHQTKNIYYKPEHSRERLSITWMH